jgi:hypothetical protein
VILTNSYVGTKSLTNTVHVSTSPPFSIEVMVIGSPVKRVGGEIRLGIPKERDELV